MRTPSQKPDPLAPLSIVQFTPFPWSERGGINEYTRRVSDELARRGHSVLIAAPSGGRGGVAETKTALAELADDPDALFAPGEEPRVISMGGGVKLPRTGKRQAPVSVDMGNRVEALLGQGRFDIVHVHDPFVPGFSSTALRHSFSLNVGTFHETEERPFATQFARPLLEIFFGRLDARTASSKTSAKLLNRYFPGSYEVTHPGVDPVQPAQTGEAPLKIAFSEREEPGALRLFLRALRRLPVGLDWTATIYADDPGEVQIRVAKAIRERIKVIGPDQASLADLLSHSDVFVAASNGPRTDPAAVRQAIAAGAVPVTTTIGRYVELVGDGQRGLLFPAGDPVTLAGQIERLAGDPPLVEEHGSLAPSLAVTAERPGPGRGAAMPLERHAGMIDEVFGHAGQKADVLLAHAPVEQAQRDESHQRLVVDRVLLESGEDPFVGQREPVQRDVVGQLDLRAPQHLRQRWIFCRFHARRLNRRAAAHADHQHFLCAQMQGRTDRCRLAN